MFQVPVDQTHTAYVNLWIDFTDTALEAEGSGLVAPTDSGEELGYTTQDTDRLQGYFPVEVILPHHKMSNIASYNISSCTPTDEIPQVRQ